MTNEKELKELSEIAMTTITEFTKSMVFCGWEDIQKIYYDEKEKIVYIEYPSETQEYELECISCIFSTEFEGFGTCGPRFYEDIDLMESELEGYYEGIGTEEMNYEIIVNHPEILEKRKEEFKEYAGHLSYVKYRAPEVLEILRMVEEEAEKLIHREKKEFKTNLGLLLEGLEYEDDK